jgi:hypothetical protein
MTHTESGLDYNIRAEDGDLYIVFDESCGTEDWAADFDFFPKTFDIYPGSGIKAHEGIAKQYMDIRDVILEYLYSDTVKAVYVAGFSLGGALTTAAVEDVAFHIDRDGLNKTVYGISYDGPRFFAPNKQVETSLPGTRLATIKTHCDPVVHVPFKVMPTLFSFRWKPFKFRFTRPRLTFWKDYGTVEWIGKRWRFWPVQHAPEQIERALEEVFGY